MKRVSNPPLFKFLMYNSLFSQFSGILMITLTTEFNAFFGVDGTMVFKIIGIGLILFGAFVYAMGRVFLSNKLVIKAITGMDLAWVVASVAVILLNPWDISAKGLVAIGAVALWIGFLAYKQNQYNT